MKRRLYTLLMTMTFLLSVHSFVSSQTLEQVYTYEVDLAYPWEAFYTDAGFVLYSIENSFDYFLTLRNDNAVIWQKELPSYHQAYDYYENETAFFYTGNEGCFGRVNKITGNVEAQEVYNELWRGLTITGTIGNNLMIGGYACATDCNAVLHVVNQLGDPLTTITSSASGELWGSSIYHIERTHDNGYILAGLINEEENCGEINHRSLWICKLNSSLNILWSKKFGNGNGTVSRVATSDYYGPEVIVTNENEIIVLGHTFCTNGSGGGPDNIGEGTFLMKLDEFGDIAFLELVGFSLPDFSQGYSGIHNSCDNTFVLSGISGGSIGTSYIIEKYDYNMDIIDLIYSSPAQTDYEYLDVNVSQGANHNYLLQGRVSYYDQNGEYQSSNFITKTSQDPACQNCENLPLNLVKFSDCENFNGMALGNISPQGNPRFTLFNGNADEQAFVVANAPDNGGNALAFENNSDIDYNIGRTIQTPARLEWRTYIPAERTGSWGLETASASSYAYSVDYTNGNASLMTGSTSLGSYEYPEDVWFTTSIVFNPDLNTIELWLDGNLIHTLTNFTSDQITDLNLYHLSTSGDNEFYVDDILYYELNEGCNGGGMGGPVCVNNQEFASEGDALCAGYNVNEWTVGGCCTEPSDLTITAGGSTTLCPGESVTLTASNICPGCEVVWNTGQFALSISVSTGGTYSATVFNACGETAGSNLISVLSLSDPIAATISAGGPVSLCNGESVTLTASNICNGCSVLWSNGSTANSINVSSAGTYYVVTSNTCGQSPNSNTITVTTNTAPSPPVISSSGSTVLCGGASITLTAGNLCSGCTVLWSNGASGESIVVSSSGTFSARVSNSCGTSIPSNEITTTVQPIFVPGIVVNATCHLAAPNGSDYQWFFNGNPIAGATSQFHTAQETGYYAVSMTSASGCAGTSDPLFVEACSSAVRNLRDKMPLFIYPNPTATHVTVDFGNTSALHDVKVELFSVHGTLVKQLLNANTIPAESKYTFLFENFSDGLYLYRISSEEGVATGQLVIMRNE